MHQTIIMGLKKVIAAIFLNALVVLTLVTTLVCAAGPSQTSHDQIRRVGGLDIESLKLINPAGLAYANSTQSFVVFDWGLEIAEQQATSRLLISPFGHVRGGILQVGAAIANPANLVYDNYFNRLLFLSPGNDKIIVVPTNIDSQHLPGRAMPEAMQSVDLEDPQGMAVDPRTGDVFVLDAGEPSIKLLSPDAQGELAGPVSSLSLNWVGSSRLAGLAFNPNSGHLFFRLDDQLLYEISRQGELQSIHDLTALDLITPQGMVFAPSMDLTDDGSRMSLFLADSRLQDASAAFQRRLFQQRDDSLWISGFVDNALMPVTQLSKGQILEISFTEPSTRSTSSSGSLVQTIDTSVFSIPSPDPAGMTYLASNGTFLLSDSEVNEISQLFSGENLFEINPFGSLIDSYSTISFSGEPTGISHNSVTGEVYITDDNLKLIVVIDPGVDEIIGSADDLVGSFSTKAFNCYDPEGIAYAASEDALYIVDGVNSEVYRIHSGANGVFDGLPPSGDDDVRSFDTETMGIRDPEGIAYDSSKGHLLIVGYPQSGLLEVTSDGLFVRMIDIMAANAIKPAGLALGPGSVDPAVVNLYIADRGIDNNEHPSENDGKIYEIALPADASGNTAPVVDAGPDQIINVSDTLFLDAAVSDDGLPDIPGQLAVSWEALNGPGVVSFTDASSMDTSAIFSEMGSYRLRLAATDGALAGSDEVVISVTGDSGELFFDARVASSADDAEENLAGGMTLTSTDLDLTSDRGTEQVVGMRFAGLEIPRGSVITTAYIQFTVDEIDSATSELVIHGEAADDALPFQTSIHNISARSRTVLSVTWKPDPWDAAGEAGLNQRTLDLAPILQEIVDRDGWTSGNAVAMIVSGVGERVAISFDGDSASAPLLHVEYVPLISNAAPSADD